MCSENGVQPDPAKVSALKNMAPSSDIQEFQAFLGLATYIGPFIKNLSNLTACLQDLVKKDNLFEWSSTHQAVFDAIKRLISDESTLPYYHPEKEITLQVDASTKSLGATLLQDGKPIAFASKALSNTETRYANMERELLAVVYRYERFHTYLFGRSFVAESNHKSLESIQLKHLITAPPSFNGCCYGCSHMTSPSGTNQGSKCQLPMLFQGSHQNRKHRFLVLTCKSMKYVRRFLVHICRRSKL